MNRNEAARMVGETALYRLLRECPYRPGTPESLAWQDGIYIAIHKANRRIIDEAKASVVKSVDTSDLKSDAS